MQHTQSRNSSVDRDLERGKRFLLLCKKLFPNHSRSKIGEKLGGYSETAVRKWQEGFGLPNKTLICLLDQGANLEWLLKGDAATQDAPVKATRAYEDLIDINKVIKEGYRALMLLSDAVESGEVSSHDARLAVEEALKIVWQAHGTRSKADSVPCNNAGKSGNSN